MRCDSSGSGAATGQKAGCGLLEVFDQPCGARSLGYRIGGSRPGPTLVVAGYAPIADAIYDRLLDLPALPRLRGSLVLITLDALDLAALDAEPIGPLGQVDRTLHLPFQAGRNPEDATREGVRSVLGLCAQLGMIAPRAG